MTYFLEQKFSFSDLEASSLPLVLIAEHEPESRALYARLLKKANFNVALCYSAGDLHDQINFLEPNILVLNPSLLESQTWRLKKIAKSYPKLLIVTVGEKLLEEDLDSLMNAGVSAHLNRKFSHPRDLVLTLRQILDN